MYAIQKEQKLNPNFIEENKQDLCASIQKTIIDILFVKLKKAAKDLNIKQIAIAGGVSANSYLRGELTKIGAELKWDVYIPKFEYCTDNAAMIAITGRYMYGKGMFASQDIAAASRLKI